ncbi:site-specific integrase [Eubacteriales bacterium OttesenSCG-928-N13]|nr:site-specific integrase [Eubacteriales bacterium OttesenSCG-928-N13]
MPRGKAPNGSGTIYQRKDGSWTAQYITGHDPGSGKRIRKTIYGKTEKEVVKKLRAAVAAIDSGQYSEPEKMPLSVWLDKWLLEFTGNVKEHTRATYETQVRVHIKPALGATALSELKPVDIQTFYNNLSKESKGTPALSTKTARNVYGVLHRALAQAVSIGSLRTNPCVGIVLTPTQYKFTDLSPLMDDEVGDFLDACRGNAYESLFFVDLYTGLRQSEIMGLTWGNIDFKIGTIYIDRQLIHEKKKGGIYKFAPPKNNRPRRITPAPSVMRMLKGIQQRQREDRVRAGAAWQNDMDLVFTDSFGKHYAHNTISHNFKKIVTSIGLPNCRFHDLRHSFAVLSIQAGIDVKTTQESLGHHTAEFTLDVYTHVSARMNREASQKMESMITEHA